MRPCPRRPHSPPRLKALSEKSGAELLKAILDAEADLRADVDDWQARAKRRTARLPRWELLQRLHRHAVSFDIGEQVGREITAIHENRSLLDGDSDPTAKLIHALTERPPAPAQRAAHQGRRGGRRRPRPAQRVGDLGPARRPPAQHPRHPPSAHPARADRRRHRRGAPGHPRSRSLSDWRNLLDAVESRFAAAEADAATLLEPSVQFAPVPPCPAQDPRRGRPLARLHPGHAPGPPPARPRPDPVTPPSGSPRSRT